MDRTTRIASALLLLPLAACSVGPDYSRPDVTPPGGYHEPLAGGLTSSPAQLDTWWRSLNDPALDALVQESISSNLDLRLATQRLREARAQRGIVASEGLPQIDAAAGYTRERNSPNTPFGFGPGDGNFDESYDNYQVGFDASWELDVFGRIRRAVEAADAEIQVAAEDRRDVLITVTSEVARNYVEMRSQQERLAIAVKNVEIQRASLELSESRFQAGLTSELDVARAKAQLETIRAAIPRNEQLIRQSMNRIAVLLGKPPGAVSALLAAAKPVPPIPPEVPVGLPGDLLRRRPDVRRAERQLAAATARIGEATADFYPRFSLTGSFGLASDQIADLGDLDSRFWSIGPSVRWPIFQGGRLRSNLEVRNAQQSQALIEFERSLLTSLEDVENTLAAYAREQVRNQSLREAVASDERAVELANELYRRGLSDFSAVIDAQRQLFLVEDELAQSTATVTLNLITLYKALGGGWESTYPEPPQQGQGSEDSESEGSGSQEESTPNSSEPANPPVPVAFANFRR